MLNSVLITENDCLSYFLLCDSSWVIDRSDWLVISCMDDSWMVTGDWFDWLYIWVIDKWSGAGSAGSVGVLMETTISWRSDVFRVPVDGSDPGSALSPTLCGHFYLMFHFNFLFYIKTRRLILFLRLLAADTRERFTSCVSVSVL